MGITKQFYNAVVLGRSPASFFLAALLGRRGFRVLLVGDGAREPGYHVLGGWLPRRNFRLYATTTPIVTKFLTELAQLQAFRRKLVVCQPMFQVLSPKNYRLSIDADHESFRREITRVFGTERERIERLYEDLGTLNASCDDQFGRLPLSELGGVADASGLEAMVPEPYRDVALQSARAWTHLAVGESELALGRLHGTWTRGPCRVLGGEPAFVEFMTERIRAAGGEVKLHERVSRIETKGGKAVAVQLEGDEHPTGLEFLLATDRPRDLVRRAPGFITKASDGGPELATRHGRFLVACVVRRGALPRALGFDALLLGEPPIWISRQDPAPRGRLSTASQEEDDIVTLEATLPIAEAPYARSKMVERFLAAFPFAQGSLRLVDSPHDGYAIWSYDNGLRTEHERIALRSSGVQVEPEPMPPRWTMTAGHETRLLVDPIRTAIENAFVFGPSVLPALGQEGELLAAWAVLELMEKAAPRKHVLRPGTWGRFGL